MLGRQKVAAAEMRGGSRRVFGVMPRVESNAAYVVYASERVPEGGTVKSENVRACRGTKRTRR